MEGKDVLLVANSHGPSDSKEMFWGCPFSRRFGSGVPHVRGESPPKKRALFVVRARGAWTKHLAGGNLCLGRAWPPKEEKACPLPARSSGLPGRGTLNKCWRAQPAPHPGPRCAPGQPTVLPSEEKPEGPSVPLCLPGQHCLSPWEAPPSGSPCAPGALDCPLLFYGAWGLCLPPPHPAPPGHRVPCRRWAASQPSCQRSELKCSLLFKAYFLAPGPA